VKLYKYRDFSKPCDADFKRLATVLNRRSFWCARPDTLNDPVELAWTCDYSATAETIDLLTELLIRVVGRNREETRHRAAHAAEFGRLEALAQPVIAGMIQQCRNEIGLVCFGSSPDNDILWKRYGGCGAGVCIELDVPENLLGTTLFRVQYSDAKRIHIDQLMHAFIDRNRAQEVYTLALLSKPSSWADEAEIRFVSRRQAVTVMIEGSLITRLILGDGLSARVRARIQEITAAHSVVLQGGANMA
jgi:hypothetical protein